jgi:phosphatidylinositol alpha-mannosyltransferase
MKIAIFNPYNFELPGGVSDHIYWQSLELRARGHEVTIITPRPRKYNGVAPEGVVFMGVSMRIKGPGTNPDISTTSDQEEIDKFYLKNKFDVVHFHEPVVPFIGRQLIASCPYPTVATLHAALPESSVGKTLGSIKPYFKSVLQHVDVLTRVSPAAGEYLEEMLTDKEVFDVPNGVHVASYTRSTKRDPVTIVFIGRLEKRKGAKYLIQAFAEVKTQMPEAKLIIAGDGPIREKLEFLTEQLELSDVSFEGYVSEERKLELLQRATIASYPAIYGESFGIVLLEALATGTPLVAGNNPGYSSVLRERGRLCLVDPKNTYEFSSRLILLLQDPTLREMLSEWGIEYVKQFDYSKIVTKYEQVYAYAIKKHQE